MAKDIHWAAARCLLGKKNPDPQGPEMTGEWISQVLRGRGARDPNLPTAANRGDRPPPSSSVATHIPQKEGAPPRVFESFFPSTSGLCPGRLLDPLSGHFVGTWQNRGGPASAGQFSPAYKQTGSSLPVAD